MLFHQKIEALYRSRLFVRCDDTGLVHYFSNKDFPGMQAEPYAFASSLGHRLQGYFYSYAGYDPDRLIIFDHGFGGGHRSYMKEIERLCAAGYRVFAYDHTGCMESEGENTRGFAQSLHDLDDCIKTLKADPHVNTSALSVMGHSWGGYATLNIPALHPDVKHIVVLSGPVSVSAFTKQSFSGLLGGYRKDIEALERESNPEYVGYDATETLPTVLTRALLIYSDNDRMVRKSIHYDALAEALRDRPNVKLMPVSGKGHNPNYTADAVAYLQTLGKAMKRAGKLQSAAEKEAFRNSFDWDRMTAQDDAVWEEILAFLK